jgi:hypothetical protein
MMSAAPVPTIEPELSVSEGMSRENFGKEGAVGIPSEGCKYPELLPAMSFYR